MSRRLIVINGGRRGFGKAIIDQSLKGLLSSTTLTDLIFLERSSGVLPPSVNLTESPYKSCLGSVRESIFADGSLDNVQQALSSSLDSFDTSTRSSFSELYLFNNAGLLDPLVNVCDYTASNLVGSLSSHIALPMLTTATFLKFAVDLSRSSQTPLKVRIINTSSLAALQPFHQMSAYCVGKAARDMHLCSLDEDMKNDVFFKDLVWDYKGLNWAPGPMQTKLTDEARLKSSVMKASFEDMTEKNWMIDPDDSAAKLVRVLNRDTFSSAAHIDYYDTGFD